MSNKRLRNRRDPWRCFAEFRTDEYRRHRRAEHSRCEEANIRTRKGGRRGDLDRSILTEFVRDGHRHRYHATKGWRVDRVAA